MALFVERVIGPGWHAVRAMAIGLGTLGAFALNNNLVGLGLLPWSEGSEAVARARGTRS